MKSKELKRIGPVMVIGKLTIADVDGAGDTVDLASLIPTDGAN